MEKNYYEILEVDKCASEEIIKKAYNTLAKKYHPDLQSEDLKPICEEKFKLINEAYETLSVPKKREEYDCTLKQNIISQEDFDAIYLENQKLKNIIDKLEQEYIYNKNQLNNILQQRHKNAPKQYETYNNYINDIEQTRKQAHDEFYNSSNSNYTQVPRERFTNLIAILLTIVILLILWNIPFIKNFLINYIFYNSFNIK